MERVEDLDVRLFADGADLQSMLRLYENPLIRGFTTNPTLMKKAGVSDYAAFAKDVLTAISDRPISFEVFADDFAGMISQAKTIASWGPNVNVKIPVMTTDGTFTGPVIRELSDAGVSLNVTAVFTLQQVEAIKANLNAETPAIVSVFAGRIADAGVDPVPVMRQCREVLSSHPLAELLWASPREVLNVIQANDAGCHIITATSDLLAKLPSIGKDLEQFSLETVKMFFDDATAAKYEIDVADEVAAE